MKAIVALLFVASTATAGTTHGRATRFADRADRHAGGASRCLGRRVLPTDWGVAVRGGRCGDLYRVTNLRTGLVVVAPKVDSGPYGAMHQGSWVLKRKASDPGVWRGVVDLTPPVFAALKAKSFDRVRVEAVK